MIFINADNEDGELFTTVIVLLYVTKKPYAHTKFLIKLCDKENPKTFWKMAYEKEFSNAKDFSTHFILHGMK